MVLKKFEKELLKNKSYKDKVIDAIDRQNNLSLSALFSSMIGPAKQDANNPLKALFYNDRHDYKANNYKNERPAASEAINNLLKLCTDNQNIVFNEYTSDNDQRITFQYKYLITHNTNVNGSPVVKESNIKDILPNNQNTYDISQFKDELFVPPQALEGKFENIFKEIHQHTPGQINIQSLELSCNGENCESLFFLIIEISSNKDFNANWLTNKEAFPNPVKDNNERTKLLSLCDYIMIVPDSKGYYLCPLYTLLGVKHPSTESYLLSSKEMSANLRVNKTVQFKKCDSEILITISDNNGKLIIPSHNGNKPIFHIFIFDNYIKPTGLPSQGGQCG